MNPFESAFYVSVGLALKGKEKVEELASKVASESKMSVEEGKKFVSEMVSSAESSKNELKKMVDDAITDNLNKMGLAKKSELDELHSKIAELEKKLK